MQTVSTCLQKYLNLVPPQASKVRVVVEVVRNECGLSLAPEAIVVRNNGIFLSCHPTERVEVIRRSSDILSTLHSKHNLRFGFIR